jgi:hypothetical protein
MRRKESETVKRLRFILERLAGAPLGKAVIRDALLCLGFAFALWLAMRQGRPLAFALAFAFAVLYVTASTSERKKGAPSR